MAEEIAVRFRVTGVVQGVAFRYYAQKTAYSLGVSGWIRNLRDGSVEGLAEGSKSGVNAFIEWCKKGPPSAKVEQVITEYVPFSNTEGFEIRR